MYGAVQTAAITIISYKPLSDLNFTRYTQLHALLPFAVYKPLTLHYITLHDAWILYWWTT